MGRADGVRMHVLWTLLELVRQHTYNEGGTPDGHRAVR
jgi:hypothetical protein